jgi:glycosyltransferase involved in cell wall biosynthesis
VTGILAPAVSVLLPVRDGGATIDACVESIRTQTDPGWELIAVDDGSQDDSLARLRAHAATDARIHVIATAPRGLVTALNTGLDHARGRFIARMDADDVARPERLARQRQHLESHPLLGLVATRVVFDGDRNSGAGYARYVDWTNEVLTHEQIRLASFVESPFAHPSVMFRADVAERCGRYADGVFPEDYELWLRWLDAGVRMEKLPDALLVWRDSPARLSRRDPRYAAEAFDELRTHYLARWLAGANPHHPDIVIWGAGRVSRRRAARLRAHGVRVTGWVDIDPRKIGRAHGGAEVVAPDALPAPGRCFVVSCVGSHDARDLIAGHLARRGYRPGTDYILAA